jgi:hypothetical protein
VIVRPEVIIHCDPRRDQCVVEVDGVEMFAGTRGECSAWADDLAAEWDAMFSGLYAPEPERISA